MGCDIHPVLERKINLDGVEKWVTVSTFEHRHHYKWDNEKEEFVLGTRYAAPAIQSRNYKRFGLFANVRGAGQEAKGLPPDVADYTKFLAAGWDSDGHSHSWLMLREALEHCLASERDSHNVFFKEGDPRKETPLAYYFGIDIDDYDNRDTIDNYRIVFWFDN